MAVTTNPVTSTSNIFQPAVQDVVDKFKCVGDFFNSRPVAFTAGALFNAGTGALIGLFTAVSPLGGAIYGLGNFGTSYVVTWISDKFNCCPDSLIAQVARAVLPMIAGISAGLALVHVAGFSLTTVSAAALIVGSIAIPIAATIVVMTGAATAALGMFAYKAYNIIQAQAHQANTQPAPTAGVRV